MNIEIDNLIKKDIDEINNNIQQKDSSSHGIRRMGTVMEIIIIFILKKIYEFNYNKEK